MDLEIDARNLISLNYDLKGEDDSGDFGPLIGRSWVGWETFGEDVASSSAEHMDGSSCTDGMGVAVSSTSAVDVDLRAVWI